MVKPSTGIWQLKPKRKKVWSPPQVADFEFEMPAEMNGSRVGKMHGSATGQEGSTVYFDLIRNGKKFSAQLRFPNRALPQKTE